VHDFRPITRFISETIHTIGPHLLHVYGIRIGNRTQTLEWYSLWPMILNETLTLQISRSLHYYLTMNISETVRDTDIVTMKTNRNLHTPYSTVSLRIRPPSATCDKVTVSVVLQRESDQACSRTIHNHDRLYV